MHALRKLTAIAVAILATLINDTLLGSLTIATPDKPTTLWELIDRSSGEFPLTPERVRELVGLEADQVSDNSWVWHGESVAFGPGFSIGTISINFDGETQRWQYTAFYIGGRCVTFQEAQRHYPDITMIRENDQAHVFEWAAKRSWGTVDFAIGIFSKCVNYVILAPQWPIY